MKEFNSLEKASIKRTAANVDRFVTQRNKKQEKIEQLAKEIDELQIQIDAWETPVKQMTGGYTTEDLVEKEIKDAGVDKNGKPIKTAKFVLKYPETVLPPIQEGLEEVQEDTVLDTEATVETVETKVDPFNL